MKIKIKMKKCSKMEDRRPQPQHAGGWAAPRWEMGGFVNVNAPEGADWDENEGDFWTED